MKFIFLRFLTIAFLLTPAGCKEDQISPPPPELFAGILMTDANGTVLGGDTTDFQPRPLSNGQLPANYSFICAYPNPADGDVVNLRFQLPQTDTVLIRVYDSPNHPAIDTLWDGVRPPGSHLLQWNWSGPKGILRAEMTTSTGFRSYGDIQFR